MAARGLPRPVRPELPLLRAANTRYPDLALHYPFAGGDAWDWIANGLRIAGHDVRYSGRPPLLPLLLAALERLSALAAFPALNLLALPVACAGLGLTLARLPSAGHGLRRRADPAGQPRAGRSGAPGDGRGARLRSAVRGPGLGGPGRQPAATLRARRARLDSNPVRVWRARRSFAAGPPPADFSPSAGDRGALFLHRPGAEPERYRTMTRLGSALRLPVQYLPRGFLEPCLRGGPAADRVPVAAVGGYALYRFRPPGLRGAWLIATAAGEPPPGAEDATGSRADRIASWSLAEARRVRRFIAGSDTVVALVVEQGRDCTPLAYLPFLVDTTEVFVLEPGTEPAAVRSATAFATLRTPRARAVRTRLLGLPAAIVVGEAAPAG